MCGSAHKDPETQKFALFSDRNWFYLDCSIVALGAANTVERRTLYSKPKGAGADLPVYSHTPADAILSCVLGDNRHNNNVHRLDGGIPTN